MSKAVGDWKYGLDDCLGQGGFGSVFLGRHKNDASRQVAIKVMRRMDQKSERKRTLVEQEIAIIKNLTKHRHQNIVPLLDVASTPNNIYLVMEYCKLGDLSDYMAFVGNMEETTISFFLRQISTGMSILNESSIVHRDLKPQNLLLSCRMPKSELVSTSSKSSKSSTSPCRYPDVSEITIKIADFGLARFLEEGAAASTVCGTPAYSAPEVLRHMTYGPGADLWSIGVIAYECLTSDRLYSKVLEYIRRQQSDGQEFDPVVPEETSDQLKDLLERLLKADPAKRMTFDEFYHHPFIRPVAASHTTRPDVSSLLDDAPIDLIDQSLAYLEAIQANIQGLCCLLRKYRDSVSREVGS